MENISDYTAADALTDALVSAGVTHVFLNSGTDYPPIIESWAKYEAAGRKKPEIVVCPHEYPALSAAQGFAQLTGRPQAVFVHVDVGTQNLGGAIHNAFRCRVPVYILAGVSPYTLEGELPGGRNAQIQFLQNVGDQAGIVRGYTKMTYELHSGKNIPQMVFRALQLAKSTPQGPVYTVASREVLEEAAPEVRLNPETWAPVAPSGLDEASVRLLADALCDAERPLIITSYLGRNTAAVAELVALCERLAIPVVEMNHSNMNFPGDNALHLGFDSHSLLKDADVILTVDSDVPWIPAAARPDKNCRVFCLDLDPLKETIPLWYIPAERFMKADAETALRQLNRHLAGQPERLDAVRIDSRRRRVSALHREMRETWEREAETGAGMTSAFVARCLRAVVSDDTVVLNEAVTDKPAVDRLLTRTRPGTVFWSGGSSLGWHGGAAVGMKLACPDKDIVALTGDGTYIFSCPTAVFWMARKYNAPFLTVIFNNSGWGAPKMITRAQHPGGFAETRNTYWASLEPPARLDMVAAAAGGAHAETVTDPARLTAALEAGLRAVRSGTPAVINVIMATPV